MKKILIVCTCAVIGVSAACSSDPDSDAPSGTDAGTDTGTTTGVDSGTAKDSSTGTDSSTATDSSTGVDAGPACTATTCSGHGTCTAADGGTTCACEAGYTGASCGSCATGFQDKDNDKACTAACGATTCSSHGTCVDTTGTAVCTCAAEYTGPACAACAVSFQDKDNDKTCTASCSATTCTSATNGTCADTSGTATCTCLGHFAGPACATCATNFTGAACDTCVAGKGGPNCDYSIVYGLNIPDNTGGANYFGNLANVTAAYDVNNSAGAGAFTRVAYRLVLGGPVNPEEVWVEMDAFTNDKTKIGVPADDVFDTAVANVTVISKAANVASIAVPAAGYIEFWSNCYSRGGGDNNKYDYKDTMDGTDCYGSMQVHVGTNTIFAYNRWASGNTVTEAGFGNNAAAPNEPDWTFSVNAASYATRRLEVFVK